MEHKDLAQKTSPRDFFLHLLAIITLYVSAVAFTTLLFQYTNIYFPDQLEDSYYSRLSHLSGIRWSIASLFIIFPVYAITSFFLNKSYIKTPFKRSLRIRKWLIYFTLFAAALIIIGDLVAVIFRLLGGELTVRFFLKVITLLFVTGSIFGYYLWDIRDEKKFSMKGFIYAIIGVIGVAIISGFFVVGSPKEARLVRTDERRVQNLQEIQWRIVNYWQSKEKLPENIALLRDDIQGFVPPTDPDTGVGYEYRATGKLSFELCAAFSRPSRAESQVPRIAKPYPAEPPGGVSGPYPAEPYPAVPSGGVSENWDHREGRTCFERTIDPDLYPPFSKTRN